MWVTVASPRGAAGYDHWLAFLPLTYHQRAKATHLASKQAENMTGSPFESDKERVMSNELAVLTEIRDLLQLLAEPAIAKRDAKLRSTLRSVVGTSDKRIKAVLLMDGTQTQSALVKASGMDQGGLSRLVKSLATAKLISGDAKHPQLVLKIPSNFFEGDNANGE